MSFARLALAVLVAWFVLVTSASAGACAGCALSACCCCDEPVASSKPSCCLGGSCDEDEDGAPGVRVASCPSPHTAPVADSPVNDALVFTVEPSHELVVEVVPVEDAATLVEKPHPPPRDRLSSLRC